MRLSEENRDKAEWAAWIATNDRLGMEFDEFRDEFRAWRFRGIYQGEKCIGAVMDLNGFAHMSVLPLYRKRWASRKLLSEILRGAMVDGKVRSTVFQNDIERIRFAEKLGFYLVKSGRVEEYEATDETIPF